MFFEFEFGGIEKYPKDLGIGFGGGLAKHKEGHEDPDASNE